MAAAMKHLAKALVIARIKANEKVRPHTWNSRKAGPWDRRQRKADGGGVLSDEDVGLGATAAPALLSDADMGIAPPSSSLHSVALQLPTGFNETLANGAGAPVDAMTWALNHIPGVKIKDPVMGSDFIKRGMGLIGANPDNAPANTAAERIARGTGSGIAAMVAPEAAVGAAGELGALAPGAVKGLKTVFGSSETLPAALGNAAVGATAGASGTAASEAAPEPYKPLAEMGGNLVGGGLGVAGVGAARGARWLGNAAKDYFAPLTEAGQEQTAGKKLADSATSPAALRDALDNPPPEMVPGSKPTTFQQTGDMGLGSLEREVATQNPADFMQRRAEQNSARIGSMESLATGSPADVSNTLRAHLRDIDDVTGQSVERAQADAQRQFEGVGGQRPPEEYGATMRDALASARQDAKSQERALWKAVDPENTLALPATPLKEAASGIDKAVTGSAKPIDGEERAILDTIGQYRSVMPFNEITDLRSRVSTAMREELRNSGETPVYGRLARLRGAIENTIANAVEYRAAQDAHAVARGEISPEQTLEARYQKVADEWFRQRAGQSIGASAANAGAGGSAPISRAFRGQGQGGSGFRGPEGGQELSGDVPLTPNFDQAARERLNTATAATRDRKQTFDAGPVGAALRSAGMQGQYRSMDSAVPAQIFRRGPSGFQSVEAYRKASGDPRAMGVLGDYAAASLRQAALKPDGTLDPVRFSAWRKAHADALRAIPELAGRFEDAATASRAVEDVAAVRRDALDHYQRGVFGQLIDAHGPDDVTRVIGGLFGQKDSAKAVRALVTETRNDPAAREGLRKAVADHIMKKFISNTEAGTTEQGLVKSDQFQTFVKNNGPALRQIFDENEVKSLRAIAGDLQRANRSITAVKLPGGSNTAQDTAARQLSLLSKLVHHGRDAVAGAALGLGTGVGTGAAFGFGSAGPIGALIGTLGGATVAAMRDAGMKHVDDLIRDAMLNPELARRLLMKHVPGSKAQEVSLTNYLRRNATAALFQATQNRSQ